MVYNVSYSLVDELNKILIFGNFKYTYSDSLTIF